MSLSVLTERGRPLERQEQTSWRQLQPAPYGVLDEDAFTRVRVELSCALATQGVLLLEEVGRMSRDLRAPAARVRRLAHLQRTRLRLLHPPDLTPLERALSLEQTSVEVLAELARRESEPHQAAALRFPVSESVDHLYRFAALYDRLEGRDANALLQGYTDLVPGRATSLSHRHPYDELRAPYERTRATFATKLHARLACALERQEREAYVQWGPACADPVARALFLELADAEEQHATAAASLLDPDETWLERWLLHEAAEVYAALTCLATEDTPRLKPVWEERLEEALGRLSFVRELFERSENRDSAALLPRSMPEPLALQGMREFVREVLQQERELQAQGPRFVPAQAVPPDSLSPPWRTRLNTDGSPSERVAAGWRWHEGTELASPAATARALQEGRVP